MALARKHIQMISQRIFGIFRPPLFLLFLHQPRRRYANFSIASHSPFR
jgi:hypothetical protein